MSEIFTSSEIEKAARQIANAMIANTATFNKLDAVGGDGDMGTTLATVSRALLTDTDAYPTDVGACFMRLAKIISKTSGSSLSAVIMTGLMAIAQQTAGQSELAWKDLSDLITSALEIMQARSKARMGDKTILDGLAAIAEATSQCTDDEGFTRAASTATKDALEKFRSRPVVIGRMRLEPSGGVGHNDPGMVALEVMVSSLGAET